MRISCYNLKVLAHGFGFDRTRHALEAEQRELCRQRLTCGWPPQGGIWAVEWAGADEMLGWCGLFPLQDSGLIEIGYRYATRAWGKGVATEAAARLLDHGFRVLAFDPIVGVTHPENRASQKVLTKIGLRPGGLRFHYGLDLSFFSLGRADYLIPAIVGITAR